MYIADKQNIYMYNIYYSCHKLLTFTVTSIFFQNFYLIDVYLVLFLCILMSRRIVWCFVQEVIHYFFFLHVLVFWNLDISEFNIE